MATAISQCPTATESIEFIEFFRTSKGIPVFPEEAYPFFGHFQAFGDGLFERVYTLRFADFDLELATGSGRHRDADVRFTRGPDTMATQAGRRATCIDRIGVIHHLIASHTRRRRRFERCRRRCSIGVAVAGIHFPDAVKSTKQNKTNNSSSSGGGGGGVGDFGAFSNVFFSTTTTAAERASNGHNLPTRRLLANCGLVATGRPGMAVTPLAAVGRNRTTASDKGKFRPVHCVGRGLLDECRPGMAATPLAAVGRNRTTASDKGKFRPVRCVGRGLLDECHGAGSALENTVHRALPFPLRLNSKLVKNSKQIPHHIYQANQLNQLNQINLISRPFKTASIANSSAAFSFIPKATSIQTAAGCRSPVG